MLPSNQHHLVTNVSIVVDEKANKLGPEDLLIAKDNRKGVDAGGIPSLRSGSSRVCCLVEALYRPKLNVECSHEVGFRWTVPQAPSITDLVVSALRLRGVMMMKSY